MSEQLSTKELANNLYKCADFLRGSVDKGKYKDYILPLVFYAEVNRKYQMRYEEELEKAGFTQEEPDKSLDEAIRKIVAEEMPQGIQIPYGYSWEQVKNLRTDDFDEEILDDEDEMENPGVAEFIDEVFRKFQNFNEEYAGVFENEYSNVGSFTESDGDILLKNVIGVIHSELYENEKELPQDGLGEAFMLLVEKFAEEEAGEYFTPTRIVRLVVSLIEPFDPRSSFHDPTVGSGGMLVEAANQIEKRRDNKYYQGNFDDIIEKDTYKEFLTYNDFEFTGQELNPDIVAVAKMNLALNELDGHIEQGNSLTNPKFTDESDNLREFDYILANFPFSQNGWKEETRDTRVKRFGDLNWSDSLPHGNYGDFAFIMHMHSHLKDDGQLATIIPHGVLFRNGDQDYREYMIENDMVEAIIGLPENLFESTGIPSAILVLNEDKPDEKKGEVMFFNANHEGRFFVDTGGNRYKLKDPVSDGEVGGVYKYKEMDNAYGTAEVKQLFEGWDDVERVCRVVSNDEIRENEYNMNIALYVDTTEPQEDIDVSDTLASVRDIEHEYQQLNQQFTQYMQQLNYEDETEDEEQDNNQGDTE